jgi:hypothetical protein
MTTAEKWLVVLGALGVGALVVWGLGPKTRPGGLSAEASGDVSVSDLSTRPHICQASHIPDAICGRHPLYRRPFVPRPGATALMTSGWSSWVTDPPSEASL